MCDSQSATPSLKPTVLRDRTDLRRDDVVCGRGSHSNNHTGNVQFRVTIRVLQPWLLTLTKKERNLAARNLILAIQVLFGGRFMRKVNCRWEEFPHGEAIQKTLQTIREKKALLPREVPIENVQQIVSFVLQRHNRRSQSLSLPILVILDPTSQSQYREMDGETRFPDADLMNDERVETAGKASLDEFPKLFEI